MGILFNQLDIILDRLHYHKRVLQGNPLPSMLLESRKQIPLLENKIDKIIERIRV